MANGEINLDAYFNRIKYLENIDISYKTLRNLHTSHVFNIPFENLDVFLGKDISLDNKRIFEKIVINNRGGNNFETNALFAQVLKKIGFKVDLLMSRAFIDESAVSQRLYQLLLVEADDNKWIADVGFWPNGLIAPLLLQDGIEEQQFSDCFRLIRSEKYGYILQNRYQGQYNNLYAFTLEKFFSVDYLPSNFYCTKSPNTVFTQKKICTKPTKEGRITLVDSELEIKRDGKTTKVTIETELEYKKILKEYLGIVILEQETPV